MKICIISDTHNKHKYLELPDADIIIHCGDFTSMGKEHEIKNFMKWFSELKQYQHKLIIAGNHDWLFETNGLLVLFTLLFGSPIPLFSLRNETARSCFLPINS